MEIQRTNTSNIHGNLAALQVNVVPLEDTSPICALRVEYQLNQKTWNGKRIKKIKIKPKVRKKAKGKSYNQTQNQNQPGQVKYVHSLL